MPRELWSREIKGEAVLRLLFQKRANRVVVSTSSGCCAIDATGGVAWQQTGLTVKAEAPDGTLVASKSSHDFILLDADGNVTDRRLMSGRWEVVGWTEDRKPLMAVDGPSTAGDATDRFPFGIVWAERLGYAHFEGHLHCYDPNGMLLSSVSIPKGPFLAKARKDGGRRFEGPEEIVEHLVYPRSFDLRYDPRHRRLIATKWSMPAWVVALGLDGVVQWVALPSLECCNFACLLASEDVVAHISSCGGRLTFLGGDGEVLRAHDLDPPPVGIFPDGERGVCVQIIDWGVKAFDAMGEPQWTLEIPGIRHATVDDRVLYAVRPQARDSLEITAFDVGFPN